MATETYSPARSAWGPSWAEAWGPSWNGDDAGVAYPVHSPADVLRWFLVGYGVGVAPTDAGSWPVGASLSTDRPDEAIATLDQQGIDEGSTHDGEKQEHYGVQVLIRARTHPAGYAKAAEVATVLDRETHNRLVSVPETDDLPAATYLIHAVNRTGPVLPLGLDAPQGKRRLFSINVTVAMTRRS